MKALRHAGIAVSDMERSLHFYRDLLGLKVVKDFREEGEYIDKISALRGVKLWMVKLVADEGGMVELLKYESHPGKPRHDPKLTDIGGTHIAFTVADIEKEYKKLTSAGIKFNSRPVISPDGYAKVAFCKDPDGYYIELVQVLKP